MNGSGANGRVARLERRIGPRDPIERMPDDELLAALWQHLPASVTELRQAAEACDEAAGRALAAVRAALA